MFRQSKKRGCAGASWCKITRGIGSGTNSGAGSSNKAEISHVLDEQHRTEMI